MRLRTSLALLLTAAAGLGGCSLGDDDDKPPLIPGPSSNDTEADEKLGFPSTATKNTIRVGGGDAAADAAGVASAVFPGTSDSTRPTAVVLVDKDDWQAGVTGAALMANPIGAPLLVSDGEELSEVSKDTLERLDPKGSDLSKDAQVIRIGDAPARPDGYKTAVIEGKDPYERAAAIDRFFSAAKGRPSTSVVVASGERAEFAMPAAAWAARSGDSVLLTREDELPPETRKALAEHEKPDIYVLGPADVISEKVVTELKKLGKVVRIEGDTAVETAIEFARFDAGRSDFGWGIEVPGYNFTLANTARPLDAAASAALATKGVFAPLLLTDTADSLPKPLEIYLLSVQPGFEDDPGQAVYNRVWILGDETQVSVATQARLDQVTELIPVQANAP
ncbi:MAG: cell wall-binding repeat-containing protein [Actinomycetota bacterium]|nr:cell wall-binding repeat-containing protein [Thermoleophilaceae bacterium]MDQ3434859.1 cell wall-binding repeat-containing protein [Actinomycetota bacterium]